MPPRLPDDQRAAILADIRAGRLGNRAIARKHGVAPSTVTSIARSASIDGAFERSQTKSATEARVSEQADERTQASAALLHLGRKALDRLADQVDKLPPRELAVVMGVAFDKHLALVKASDADEQAKQDAARRHAAQLTAALRLAVTKMGLTPEQETKLGPALRDAVTALTGEAP